MNEAQRLARLVLIVGAIWSGSFALLAPPDTPPVVAGGQIVYLNSGLINIAENANEVQGVIANLP